MNSHRLNLLRRQDAQALVDGTASGSTRNPPGNEAVAAFLDGLRHDAATLPAPAPRPRLAATLDGRRPLRPASDPIPSPARTPFPARLRALRPATIAIASGAVFFGGLATAGALPGPLQHASANLTAHVGVHLPGASRVPTPSAPVNPGAGQGSAPTSPATATPAATNGTTTTTTPSGGGGATPVTAPAVKHPTTPTTPVKIPVNLPGTVPVTVPVKKPPIVVTLPSLPIELPGLPTSITIPRLHGR